MKYVFNAIKACRKLSNQKGVSMIEYGLLIAVAAVATLGLLGTNLNAKFVTVSDQLK